MRAQILVVEDDDAFGAAITQVIAERSPQSDVWTSKSRDSSLALLDTTFFDLIILDLNIPSSDGSLDADAHYGLAVFSRAQRVTSGTPLFVLTGSPAEDFIPDLLKSARQIDVWGEGKEIGTVGFLAKYHFDSFSERIGPSLLAINSLADVELERVDVALSVSDDRLIRIFARRFRATRARVSALGGGLSSAKVLRIQATDAQGGPLLDAVAKLGTRMAVVDEGRRFDDFVSRLEAKATPRKLMTLEAGAGSSAGVFYGLAGGFNATAFAAAARDLQFVSAAVRNIEACTSPWRGGMFESRRQVIDVRRRLISDDDQKTARGSSMGCPARVKEYLVTKLGGFDHEVFGMLLLDTQLRLISYVELFHGTIDSAAVYPREVVRCVLNHNANAVILAHNHPSGCPDPSAADRALTERLAAALKLIDVRTLDHVIVGGVQTSSYAEMGLL